MASGLENRVGVTFELLWTNPDTASSFSAQTVDLDLTKYDGAFITFLAVKNNLNQQSTMICPKSASWASVLFTVVPNSTTARTRNVYVKDAGVQFASGYGDGTSDDGNAVPYKIYGIKGMTFTS